MNDSTSRLFPDRFLKSPPTPIDYDALRHALSEAIDQMELPTTHRQGDPIEGSDSALAGAISRYARAIMLSRVREPRFNMEQEIIEASVAIQMHFYDFDSDALSIDAKDAMRMIETTIDRVLRAYGLESLERHGQSR